MVNPNDLVPGQCYYHLFFYHPRKIVVGINTLFFVGKNLFDEERSEDEWYFQDPESYLEHGSFMDFPEKIEHETLLFNEDALRFIYDLDGLIEEMKKIKEREK